MFARIVDVHIKPDQTRDVINTINDEVLDTLRDQQGFVDMYTLTLDESSDRLVAISIWNSKDDAEKYAKTGFNNVKKALNPYLAEPLHVRPAELVQSTSHKDLRVAA